MSSTPPSPQTPPTPPTPPGRSTSPRQHGGQEHSERPEPTDLAAFTFSEASRSALAAGVRLPPRRTGPQRGSPGGRSGGAAGNRSGTESNNGSGSGVTAATGYSATEARRSTPAHRRRRSGWTGSGPDHWDPQTLTALVPVVTRRQGWQQKLSETEIVVRWPDIAGQDLASHVRAVEVKDRVLYLQAESTAWSTNVRMMQRHILSRIAKVIGPDLVTKLHCRGPQAPSWRHGPFHVKGRGPRDTYG